MKIGHTKRVIFAMLCAILVLLMGTISASALEVSPEVKEISIPVSIAADKAIAGAEVEFSWTAGLEYVKFVPAQGISNPIETDRSGKHYAGFFTDSNQYAPTNGSVQMGTFVFSYTSADPEVINFSETRAHTMNGSAVDSAVVNQNTKITVKRTGDPGTDTGTGVGTGDPGTGIGTGDQDTSAGNAGTSFENTDVSGGGSTLVLPPGTGSGATRTAQGQDLILLANQLAQGLIPADAATGGTDAVENAAANDDAGVNAQIGDGRSPTGAGSDAQIESGLTPLTQASGNDVNAFPPLLWIVIILAAVILFLFLLARKRKKDSEASEERG